MKWSYRFEGGPYHNAVKEIDVAYHDDPPEWMHLVPPIAMDAPGPVPEVVLLDVTPEVYRRQRRKGPGGPSGGWWVYVHWTPEASTAPETEDSCS